MYTSNFNNLYIMPDNASDLLIEAHRRSIGNYDQLKTSSKCGCFYCGRIYNPQEIEEWIDDKDGPTALCPYCGIDSVLAEVSGLSITEEFLAAMNQYWF